MLQACAQAVDFKVGHHFGEGQAETSTENVTFTLHHKSIGIDKTQGSRKAYPGHLEMKRQPRWGLTYPSA